MKKFLSDKFSFSIKRPLLAIILDHELSEAEEKNFEEILQAVEAIDIQAIVLADTNLSAFASPHAIFIPYGRDNRNKILEAADMALCFSFNDVEEMLLNGTIPVTAARPEVDDYNPNRETGNSFIYRKMDHWSIFAALVRALETFKFPYDWTNIVRQGRASVRK